MELHKPNKSSLPGCLMKFKSAYLLFFILFVTNHLAYAEYRTYLLEVYDHIDRKKWDAVTGFPPD